jgi:hypothetical protein
VQTRCICTAARMSCRRCYLGSIKWQSLPPYASSHMLFEQIVKMDLEGIVCKRKDSPYKVTEKPSRYWIKVKNSRYSQLEGREELFER